jgi:hypothetical protein
MNLPHLFKRRTFNDSLALVLVVLLVGLWVLDSITVYKVSLAILGASIGLMERVVSFYFRKQPPSEPSAAPTP